MARWYQGAQFLSAIMFVRCLRVKGFFFRGESFKGLVDTYRLTSIFQPQSDQQLFSFVSFEKMPPNTDMVLVEIMVVCCHREGNKEG